MKKISCFKFLLAFMLVFGSLVGCQSKELSEQSATDKTQAQQIDCSKQSDQISLDEAYNNFNKAQTKFLEDLTSAVNNTQIRQSVNSSNVGECLKKLQAAITTFKNQELPKLDQNNQASASKTIDDIIGTLNKISAQVITPLNKGLTEITVSQLQDKINLNISQDQKGKFGPQTQEKIETFLLRKTQSIEGKIRDLNLQILSAQVTSLQKENQSLKNPYNLAFWLALLAILISIFKGSRSRKSQENIPSRETRNNRGNLFSGIKYIGTLIRNRLGQEPTDIEQEDTDGTVTNNQDNLLSSPISEQDYQRIRFVIHDQVYHELNDQLNQRRGNLEEQIFTAVNQRMEQLIKNSETRIEQKLERKITSYLPAKQETRRQPQTRIPTLQDRQQTSNQTPVVSPPQVSRSSTAQWIDTYNHNPNSLSRNVTEVSETEESLSNRRIGSSQTVILATKRRGNYWVLTEGGYDYLVPSQSLRINQHNYKTVEALFECRNYHPDYSSDFQLLKPAVVVTLSGGKTWQLQEAGILQF